MGGKLFGISIILLLFLMHSVIAEDVRMEVNGAPIPDVLVFHPEEQLRVQCEMA